MSLLEDSFLWLIAYVVPQIADIITRSKYLQVSVQKNIKTTFFCKVIIELLRDSDKLCSTSAGTIVKK